MSRVVSLPAQWQPEHHVALRSPVLPVPSKGGARLSERHTPSGQGVAPVLRRLQPPPPPRAVAPDGLRAAAVLPAPGADACADTDNPVVVLLKEAGLSVYTGLLLRNGFDDMDALMEISDGDMRDMGIPVCHAVRLKKRLQKLGLQTSPERTHCDPVVAFLQESGLGRYCEALIANGFDEMETLHELSDCDARDLGITRGHWLKLRRRLRERSGRGAPEDSPGQGLVETPTSGKPGASACVEGGGSVPSASMQTVVEKSWARIQELGHCEVGGMLYKNLFEMFPAATAFFPHEVQNRHYDWEEAVNEEECEMKMLRRLGAKVISAIGNAVAGLHDIGRLVPMLAELGLRHAGYGAQAAHYQMLGQALHRTLQQSLGELYTREVELAWMNIFAFISAIMIQGLQTKLPADSQHDSARLGSEASTSEGSTSEGGRGRPVEPFLALALTGREEEAALRRQRSGFAEECADHSIGSGLFTSVSFGSDKPGGPAPLVSHGAALHKGTAMPGKSLPILLGQRPGHKADAKSF